MTLAKGIIPTLLVNRSGALVKGRAFASDRIIGNPVQQARVYTNVRDVDELVVLAVHATLDGAGPNLNLIRQVSETAFIPLVYGGGISTVDEASACIRAGAERVVVGSAPILNPESIGTLISRIAEREGSNAVTVSVDFQQVGDLRKVAVRSGTLLTSMTAEEWARIAVQRGAGEVLLQSVDRDGTLGGYDLDAIRSVRAAVPGVRLIASGGCANYADMAEAFDAGADACAVGALFSFTDATPARARAHLMERGYNVRPPMRPLEKAT